MGAAARVGSCGSVRERYDMRTCSSMETETNGETSEWELLTISHATVSSTFKNVPWNHAYLGNFYRFVIGLVLIRPRCMNSSLKHEYNNIQC